ncbi:uncharacterized protein LOC142608994 [Castanea sativa]|uniref:uncharacterized protein LOC142608994 n=1 Tax=Castanea sativa TaxID=21020 RepID=UPI003F64F91B
MTNNKAEYEALIVGLDLARVVGATNVVMYCDSQVVTSQVTGGYECKSEQMKKYLEQVKYRVNNLQAKFIQILREENEQANRLAKAASAEHMLIPSQVLSFVQNSPLINGINIQEVIFENNWTTPITSYLKESMLLDSKEAIRKLKVQAAQFVLIKGILYKRGFSRPYLRCLNFEEADYVMREVHEGVCGNHSGSWSLVHKLIRAEYYWPTMQKDAHTYVKACDKCQRFGNLIRQPTKELTPMMALWPFVQWGLDIMESFLTTIRNQESLLITRPPSSQRTSRCHKSILAQIIKTRLKGAKGIWLKELPSILWAYRTTTRKPTGKTLFRLAYGSEAVILAEVGLTSYRVGSYDESGNDEAMHLQLDLVDEVRVTAEQRLAQYQDLMAKHYNSKVRHRDFQVRDLILRKVTGTTRDPAQRKLGPNWEGPYKIESW